MTILNNQTSKHKVWGGGVRKSLDPLVEDFLAKSDIGIEKGSDYFLIEDEILSTIAHVTMLKDQHIITNEIGQHMLQVLKKLIENPILIDLAGYEDVHSVIEDIVIKQTGYTPHIGRSRNDQIATVIRLHYKKQLTVIHQELITLIESIGNKALRNLETIIPLYTHYKQAEISTIGHLFHSYMESLTIDIESLQNCISEIDCNPLGSAALAGTSYPINREQTTTLLNFSKLHSNTLSAISDRGLIDFKVLSIIVQILSHSARIAKDLIFYSLDEIEIIQLADNVTTGSSIMPQKKNPDLLEIIISKADLFSSFLPFVASVASKSSGYHRELQESKRLLVVTLRESIIIVKSLQLVFLELKINKKNILKDEIYAVEIANFLVKNEGISFREAHDKVTQVIVEGTSFKKDLITNKIVTEEQTKEIFNPLNIIQSKTHSGSPNIEIMKTEIEQLLKKKYKKS